MNYELPFQLKFGRAHFARDAGVSEKKKIFLVEDNAGWHRSKNAEIPEGVIIEFLPPYSPELYAKRYPLGQPAERLWKLVDEPLIIPANTS